MILNGFQLFKVFRGCLFFSGLFLQGDSFLGDSFLLFHAFFMSVRGCVSFCQGLFFREGSASLIKDSYPFLKAFSKGSYPFFKACLRIPILFLSLFREGSVLADLEFSSRGLFWFPMRQLLRPSSGGTSMKPFC